MMSSSENVSSSQQTIEKTIQDLIKNDPGSFAIYRLTTPTTAQALYYSPDRPAVCGCTPKEYQKMMNQENGPIYQEDAPYVAKALQESLRTGKDADLNYRILHKTLGFVWLHAIYRFIGYLDKKPVFIASFHHDANENQLYSQLLSQVKTMIFVIDTKNYQILFANKAALDFCGKNSNYAGLPCYSYIRNRSEVCPDCFFRDLADSGESCREIYRPKQHAWQRICTSNIIWCGHEAVIQTIEDITDYKLSQRRLLKEKMTLEDTISSIPVGIAIFRKTKNNIERISLNDNVLAIKGVDRKVLQNEKFEDIFQRVWPSDKARVIKDTETVFRKGHSLCIYRTRNEASGKYIWLRREGRCIAKADGTKLAYFTYVDISAQMEIDDALKNSRLRYQYAVEGGHIAVWEYDVPTKSLISTENSLRLLGIPNNLSSLPESLFPYFTPASWPDIQEQIQAINEGKIPPEKDLWLKPHDGISSCYKVTYTVARDEKGNCTKAYGVAQNVTLQKELEEQYGKLSQEFLSLNPEALCSFRLNLSKDECTGGHGSSQYIKQKLSSKSATGFFKGLLGLIDSPEDLAKAKDLLSKDALITKFHAGEKNLNITYRRQMEKGEHHWVTTYIALIQNPHTQDIEALLYSVDSNEAVIDKLISEKLTHENYEFTGRINVRTGKIIFPDSLPDDGSVPHTEDDFDQDIASAAQKIMSPEEAQRMAEKVNIANIQQELSKAPKYTYTFTLSQGPSKGQVKALTFTYLNDTHDEILLARADVSETVQEEKRQADVLEKALEEAKKANQLKTDFISNVSHDMRTPLNGVIGYTDMALESDDIAVVKEDLRKIRKSGELLMSLINDTLDLSRIENGRISLQKTTVSLADLLQKIATSTAPSIQEKHLDFHLRMKPKNPPQVSIDVLKVTEIINNLLSNAIKFTPKDGKVSLTVNAEKEKTDQLLTSITVKDSGVGMSEAFQAKAFEPFSQERTEKNADVGGSGLGLSIVAQLVHFMGGEITMKSVLNQGTEITVILPMQKALTALPPSLPKATAIKGLRGKRVLLVEDNWMNAEIAKNILSHEGITVEGALNGVEALNLYLTNPAGHYDAILMDIRMPIMNGFDAAKAIRNSNKEDSHSLPIIAMTADAYEDDVKRCLEAGMDSHVSKPIDRNLLLSELSRLIKA